MASIGQFFKVYDDNSYDFVQLEELKDGDKFVFVDYNPDKEIICTEVVDILIRRGVYVAKGDAYPTQGGYWMIQTQ